MDDTGNIVEVHRGYNEPENHYYLVGKLNASNKTISWGDSKKYVTGSTLAMAMDNSGNVVEVHCGYNEPENHYYLVGTLDATSKTISWGGSQKYDTGSTLAVAMDNNGNVVEVHCGYNEPENHYYLVGALTRDYTDTALRTIAWSAATKYDTGSTLAVAMDNSASIVEVHRGYNEPENHYYLVGRVKSPD